jgi:hypothetical protein
VPVLALTNSPGRAALPVDESRRIFDDVQRSRARLREAPVPPPIFFGRDPNDLANARGRLPNDRRRVFLAMGSLDVPRTGLTLAANFQHFSGKPWAEPALVSLPQNTNQRMLLEPRGSRRLSSQSFLDVRLSKTMRVGGMGRVDVHGPAACCTEREAEPGTIRLGCLRAFPSR